MDMAPWVRGLVLVACLFPATVESMVRHYKFNVVMKNSTKLCSTKPIVTVNGQFPGPTLVAREDDTVLVKVEKVILLGEWWKSDVEAVINEATKSGVAPNVSDAHTINGHPGPVSACSSLGGYNLSGVWFMHCHLEIHTTWGLKMAFVVDNGKGPNESVLPPPPDLPKC
ncbi:MULTI-COPPER OXIDASE [Salix viminalis]|uniref:MULTI-COPPER OXIDASE n=1 Tax=Salix viminalis TaxID=40686 RepID=A0A9Q0SB83_SALVM|nr:MULTI-COPPER OXIDASE [Salix viminalis]